MREEGRKERERERESEDRERDREILNCGVMLFVFIMSKFPF